MRDGGKRLLSWSYGTPTRYARGAGVAVGGSGNVFVADVDTNRVLKFDPFGHLLQQWDGFQLLSGCSPGLRSIVRATST